jgi:histidine triad (HIT) family protein
MSKKRIILYILIAFTIGVGIGGYVFSETRTRPFLAVRNCEGSCFKTNEALGLLASIGIQKFPGFVPSVIKETDKTIAIKSPDPQAPIHDIIIPKKDIKNIGELSEEDEKYITDVYAVIDALIKEQHLTKYKIITNGPGYQQVTYLHFHLLAPEQ